MSRSAYPKRKVDGAHCLHDCVQLTILHDATEVRARCAQYSQRLAKDGTQWSRCKACVDNPTLGERRGLSNDQVVAERKASVRAAHRRRREVENAERRAARAAKKAAKTEPEHQVTPSGYSTVIVHEPSGWHYFVFRDGIVSATGWNHASKSEAKQSASDEIARLVAVGFSQALPPTPSPETAPQAPPRANAYRHPAFRPCPPNRRQPACRDGLPPLL